MGLEEPQVLIEFASYLREQIGGDGVVQIARFLNRAMHWHGAPRYAQGTSAWQDHRKQSGPLP